MKKVFIVFSLLFSTPNAFSYNLEDTLTFSKSKDSKYRYAFSLAPSEHGTRNTLDVKLKCLRNNSKKNESFEVCSLIKSSVKAQLKGARLTLSFDVYERADFSEYYEKMEKSGDQQPDCDLESKSTQTIVIQGCK